MVREKDAAFTLALIQAVVMLDYGCVGAMRTVLPYYAKSLGAAATGVGALETIYGLGQVIGALLLGKLSDRRGRKVVLLLSFAGSAVGYGMAAFAVSTGSASLLLLSRLPVGLAKQTITASRSVISDVTSHADRTSVMARLFSSMALGYACGPVLGGVLLDSSSVVELPAIMCALTFVLLVPTVLLLLPETRSHALTPAAAAAAPDTGQPAAARASWLRVSAAWQDAGVRAVLFAAVLPEAALVAGSTTLPLYVHELGWSPSRLGSFHSAWGLGGGLLGIGPLAWLLRPGRLSDRTATLTGDLCLACATLGLAVFPAEATVWLVLAPFIPAVALLRTCPASLLSKAAPAQLRGEALALLDAASSVARIVMPILSGALTERHGVTAPFWLQAAMGLAGVALLTAVDPRAEPARGERAKRD